MKNNKEILNEAFFKKTSYSDKLAQRMPQYEPVPIKSQNGSQLSGNSSFPVSDIDEVKKRLAGTFGVAFGNNSIRSMASKAIKTFPILVSDNLDPDTVIMIKKLMEDQYAEYINLLVSNQVVDLGAFETGSDEGNIAIQALDTISGTDFSSTRIADKAAATGKFSTDDIFTNTPLYNLLRENKISIQTEDELFNTLLENALVVPSDNADTLVEYVIANSNEMLDEATIFDLPASTKSDAKDEKIVDLSQYLKKQEGIDPNNNYFTNIDHVTDKKLTNTNILVDKNKLDNILDRTIGETLLQPENKLIRDRFEKATFLLECGRISGSEYINYLTIRLGIPVSRDVQIVLLKKYRIDSITTGKVVAGTVQDFAIGINREDIRRIANNRRITDSVCQKILNGKLRAATIISASTAIPTNTAAGAGLAAYGLSKIGGAAALGSLGAALGPMGILGLGALAGAVVGGGAVLLTRMIVRRRNRFAAVQQTGNIEGWERVEQLIQQLDKQRADLLSPEVGAKDFESLNKDISANKRSFGNVMQGKYEEALTGKELDKEMKKSAQRYQTNGLKEHMSFAEALESSMDSYEVTEDVVLYNLKENLSIFEELENDKEFMAELLEKDLATSMRMKTKYIEKKPGKDILITPEFAARTQYAYGSTEIERRDNKDRRYNQPLIMTIKFKERFSDGKYSDNELTAVIGILGKVIRVPSEEMKYILKSNAEGETIQGILNGGSIKNLVSDILSTSKISKDIQSLPQSADVWKNLEKVASLAVANKYAGKKSNNIANAHIVFSQKEIDEVRSEEGIDYFKNVKYAANLMKRYSAFTLMVANDAGQRVYIYDDVDAISWNVVPYSALMGKDSGDQLVAALSRLQRM